MLFFLTPPLHLKTTAAAFGVPCQPGQTCPAPPPTFPTSKIPSAVQKVAPGLSSYPCKKKGIHPTNLGCHHRFLWGGFCRFRCVFKCFCLCFFLHPPFLFAHVQNPKCCPKTPCFLLFPAFFLPEAPRRVFLLVPFVGFGGPGRQPGPRGAAEAGAGDLQRSGRGRPFRGVGFRFGGSVQKKRDTHIHLLDFFEASMC